MPNGGIDNCFTCWFNTRNKGEVNHRHERIDEGEDFCSIRQLSLESDPAYTYCANSPYNTSVSYEPSDKVRVPIGGVYVVSDNYKRTLWKPAPDSKEIRQGLLHLIARIEEQPVSYGGNIPWDDMVIYQLGENREVRAIEELERIAAFDPETKSAPPGRNRQYTVKLAREALQKIRGQSSE